MENLFEVLFEDEALLALHKPAGLVCHPTKGDAYSSLISRVRLYLGGSASAEPQLLNRLDRETSGIVLVGKAAGISREIRRIWEGGQVDKRYFAIVRGHLQEARVVIDAPLGKDESSAVAIKGAVRAGGAASRTEVERLAVFSNAHGQFSLLEARPLTGRKHQIRIHLAHLGHPIVGDKIYGGDERIYLDFVEGRMSEAQRGVMQLSNHALHAHRIDFKTADRHFHFEARPEREFLEFLDETAAAALDKPLREGKELTADNAD